MRYQVFEDTDPMNMGTLVLETDNFIEALKQARKTAIQKVNRVFVYSTNPNSDMHISYDPLGRQIIN